jgi:hypothetical protein
MAGALRDLGYRTAVMIWLRDESPAVVGRGKSGPKKQTRAHEESNKAALRLMAASQEEIPQSAKYRGLASFDKGRVRGIRSALRATGRRDWRRLRGRMMHATAPAKSAKMATITTDAASVGISGALQVTH